MRPRVPANALSFRVIFSTVTRSLPAHGGLRARMRGERLGESFLETAAEAVGLGDRGGIHVGGDAAGVAVGNQRDHRRAFGERPEAREALHLSSPGGNIRA